ncbi:beta strand repeat-containing protein [Sphingomonas sp. Root241]|uniref:beta strand repeat-containing protein n=1 Tax=Sphingomonas sp. Root241 TaxID=1736501 RepID=UPI0006FF07BD|nr:right-handed parallel beta-helix repeat-containing protein [Sphingomonas sp. Root241]KRC78957.1 hypothetical protein ASE13_16065 [Sphingomonas sp. Root241]
MRKSSKARLFSTCLTGAILAAASPAWGQTSDAPTWKPRAEVDAQVGKDIGVSTSLFAPIAQNDSSLVYVDGRIGYDQRFDRNGSATIGARVRVGEDVAIGVNAGADFYRSDIGSRDQAAVSMGLEGFTSVFDARVNYRLPLSKTRTIGYIDPAASGSAALVLENNRLIERHSGFRLEAVPLQGFNGEAGVRLPVGGNASIRGSVGGFDYWDKDADENYRGIRGGLEMDIEDRNSGARFTFGGTVEHDNRFGTDARATVRLSVPFGGRSGDRGAVPTGLDRQMGDRVRRDYVARSGSRYRDLTTSRFAVDARTGNEFGGFYYASGTGVAGAAGTLATPTTINDAVTRAGANGVVVALGSGGNITTPGVTLATNQYLLGGAGAVDVRLLNGSTAQFALGGTNGVIVGSNAAGATVTLGQGSVVRDVTIRGAGTGIAANGVGGFAIDRVIVENTGGAGISLTNTLGSVALTGLTVRGGTGAGVLVNGGSSVSLANSTISGGAGAVDINDGGANLAVSLSGLTLSATGGNVLDIDGSGAGTVTVTGLSGITIRGGTGETGGLSVRSATFDANTTTAGIQTVNAGRMEVGTTAARVNGQGVFLTDVIGSLSFTDLDIANSGATGLHVVNSKVNGFTLATLDGTIDTVGGTAADLDPLVIDLNFASISSVGAAGPGVILNTVQGGGTGGNALTIGTLTISNSGGDGLVILNSTGLVRVNGGAITNSGGSSVRIGTQGVAGSGGSTNLLFGASVTDPTGTAAIVAIFNTSGTLNFTGPISGRGPILVRDTLAGSAISFGAITLTGTAGDAITLGNLAGSINFAGLVTIANPGANGIVIGNVPGGVTFGNVDITGLGNFTGLDVTGAHGNVLFNTLDITGTGAGKGIDVTGSTNAGNVIVLNGSIIQGVNIGVDLTQANMTGQFRFGDGNPVPLNSTIAANIPIVIALMNASNGSYNFADANLVGDTSNLTGAGFTAYYARVGATGAGTRSDPGSLAGADASNAQYIVLLNDPAGGQDVFDAASAGGSFDLAAGQSLVSFLNGDFVAVSGAGLPANLTVSGIGPAGITNVYAGSGGAVLTTTTAGSATVNLSNNSRIDGLVIRNAGNDVGVEGVGVSGVTIANSDIGGSAGAIAISDGGAAASVTLTHLDLSSSAGTTLSLSGAGAGTLTVSASDVDIAATGTSAAASLIDLNSGGIAFGTISTGISAGSALTVQGVTGGGVAIGSVAVGGTGAGAGVAISGNSAAVTIGAVSVAGSAGDALQITGNSGAVSVGAVSASASGGDSVELSGNSGTIAFGALSSSGAAGAGLNLLNTLGNVTVGSASISGGVTGVSINGVSAAGTVTIAGLAVTGSGTGVALADVDGAVSFTGTTSIANPGTSGIVIGAGSAGTISFGDVDITGLGAGTTGVDARNASGTVNFNTLDITGSSTAGTRGIDLTGAAFATNFTTTESGSITGVGIGVDLTNAAITGSFRYGDGSNTDADGAASSINAVTPIVITGINVGTGSYNFLDVALTGDTSTLTSSATLYFVKAGATGVGTIADPGSLAGAEASAADTIILLNDPTGGQDILDAAGAGGSFDLAAGRSLLSFLNGDTLTLPGGAPANLLLFGIPSGQIGNPFAGSGAPVLTTTMAGANTVNLGGSNLLDGLIIGNGVNGIGVVGDGVANITIRNSHISGPGGAIALSDAGLNASVALSNLTLSSTGGMVAFLDGTGGGTLAVTQLSGITILGGNGETDGFYADGVLFDADLATAGAQAVTGSMTIGTAAARVDGTGLTVNASDGSLDFVTLDVVNANDVGVLLTGNLDLTAIVRAGSIDTLGGDALVGVNAALTLDFGSIVATDGGIFMINTAAANAGEPVLNVAMLDLTDGGLLLAGSGDYVFTNASITDSAGIAVFLTDSANLDYSGDITTSLGGAVTLAFVSHTGTASFHDGTIDVTDGDGFQFIDADGTYSFTGTATLHGGDAGINVANGSSGTFSFGAGTSVTNGAIANFVLQNSDANVTYLGSLTQGLNTDNFVVFGQTGGVVDFSQATISASAGSGLLFLGADGTSMLGDVQLSGDAGIEIAGSSGTISFGNVDITAVGANQTAVDLTGALGNVTFQTLDIAGASTVGTKGIDLSGSTTAANIIVNESSSITGVGIGVDLTNAAITGNFRYGDGSNVDADGAASTISAVTPLVIAGLNPGGTYDFRDVVLTGDTTSLQTNKTVFWVQAGATGAGTRADPGSLAAAEASGVDVIILLDAAGAGQDVIDAASAGGGLDLVANQSLLSFLGGDTLSLGGGAPANLLLYGIAGGSVTNPYAGSGAPLLTTSQAGATTVNLAAGALIDGVQIGNLDAKGVYGGYLADVTIRNSVIFGGVNAIEIVGNGGSAALSNLDLSSATGDVLRLRGDGGNLIVTQLANLTIRGGTSGRGLFGEQLVFDASVATAGIQAVTGALTIGSSASRIGGSGLVLDDVTGTLSLIATIFNTDGDGIFADGGAGGFTFAITGGTIDTGLVTTAGSALNLANLSADLQLDSVTYSGLDSGVLVNNVTGVGTGGRALDIDTLTVASGADSGISLLGTTSGNFSFGSASSITGTSVAGIAIANTGAGTFTYDGSITAATGALISVSGGDIGNATFSGALNATGGTGLQFDNADGTYNFTGTTTLNGGDAGIDIVNGSSGTFTFGTGTSITSPTGTGLNVQNSTAGITYSGNLTYATAGQLAVEIVNHSGGTITFQTGTLGVTNGSGVRFDNADGTYAFTGTATLSGVTAGFDIGNGSSGTFNFGSGTSVDATVTGLGLANSAANVTYAGTLTSSAGYAFAAFSDQSTLDISSATLNVTSLGLNFNDADGVYTFGSFALSNGASIVVANDSDGTLTFGDVDITGTGAGQTAVNLTGAMGGVTFNTLDITGTSTVGSRGINLFGNTGTGDIVVTNSSTITGVGVGVDLTNASRTGLFQYGDGESAIDVASTISATTPLVITGLNGGTGIYNFADVNLVGDTSGLATTATVYYVLAGATGSGTLGDPGSLAGAEAAAADIIILLNNPAGGQDVLDALGSNGNDTLQLDVNQALRSFLNGDTITLPGGAPANVILTGVVTGQVTNPYAGSGAPILTTTGAANTVTLANNSLIDGVSIQSASGFAGVYGSGVTTVTLSNATLSGTGTALRLLDGGAAATATLTNLSLSASGGSAAVDFSGAGAGSLTLTGSGLNVSHSGSGSLLTIADIVVGGGNLTFGTVASTASGAGVDLGSVAGLGTLSFGSITVAGASGSGVALHNSSAIVNLGDVTVSGAAGAGIQLTSNSGATTIGTIDISSSATGIAASGLTSTLTVGDGTIDGATTAGILLGAGNTVLLSFGNIDITALQTGARGVDARSTGGSNVYFETLDISGASAIGTRGIDLTGNTGLGNFTVNESSTITGVGIGVDLTNASRTGGFRYGDGSNVDADLAASTINATTPIVVAGLNGATGTYDFRDATLVGDTSPLEVSAFFVRAGATGVGSRSDPGSLAAADASTASFIVLLDAQAGAGSFDTISGTLTLANNQSLLSFRDTDIFNVGGGAPPNVFVFNVTTGTITNPNSGSGAPLLTSADATGTVQLAGTSVIDGVVIANTGTGAGIYANGTAGIATIRNSTISGGGAAVDIRSGALVRTANLQNLTLANAGNQMGALLNLNGTGGTLTVTGMSNLSIGTAGGETAGLVFDTVTFDSDLATGGIQAVNAGALTIGTTGARVQGDGLSLTNVSGSLTFSDLDIANTGGTGLLVANSKANSFLLTTADGSFDTTFGTAVNLDPLTVNMTVSSVTATNGAYGIQLDQVEGFFTVTGAVNVTNATIAGIAVENNTGQADALDATFSGAVTINNTVGAGLSLTNNAGATIIFGGGGTGVDVVTTGGAALNASGGTLSIAGSGNSLTSGTGQTMTLSGLTVGAPGINFASVSANGAATAVVLTSVTAAGGGAINLGTVNLQGITSRGIDVNTALGAALSITDLDIGLNSTTAVAVDLNGAALAAGITANDFDVTNAAAAGTSIAVDLRGTTGGQGVTLGDSAAGGAAATIAGVNTGIWLDATTNAAFTYGDGESAIDSASTISAATGINAAAAPAVGTYNFRDVTFGASPGLGFGVGRTWFVDSNGATGGGNGSGADGANPMTLAAAELALAATDVIVLVNNGIAISAAGSNGNDTLNLLADTQVRGFGQGPLALTLTVPSTILLSGNTINIADPTGNGAATLTTAAGASVITLGASGNHISGFILDGAPAGALRGIVDGAGATGTVIDFMTIRNFNQVNGYGVEITPSTNTVIDNVTFTGNTNDVLLNAAGSTITNVTATGATGTSITLDNATGTTTLTNLSISGAATGLSFTNAGGTITATNVDITGAATSALTVTGGTAGFTFDGASSIIQAAGGLTLNVANHSIGTFAFAGLINATSGNGMQFNNADGTYNFPGITTLNGGNAGIDIYNGATGTFAFGSATSLTHNNAGNAFVLLSGANVTFDGSITDNDGIAVEIDAHDAGTATFNGTISSSIGNASTVISIINSNGGAINFNGIMNLASTAASVVNLSGNNGSTVTFNAGGPGLDITSTTGTGMIITGGGTVNVLGSGNSITTTSGTLLSVTDTGGTTTNVNLSFASASNTSGANGIFVQRTGAGSIVGTINIAGGAITATTRGVSLNGDALNFTYGGTITTSGAASRTFEATNRTGGTATLSGNITDTSLGISVTSNSGGTINLTGQTISLNSGTNAAVTLSNNTGTTINFAPLAGGNGLDIVTTSGAGFSATGGGTVTVSGTGNSIQTATGQVINLTGVSAGASGINFASLQSTGIVAGIAINLNNLDSVGSGAFSGGTTSVAATSGGNDGIFIGNGTAANVSFGATTIGTGTVSGDGIEINGAGNGAVTFTSVAITNTTAHGVSIVGAAGATGAIAINGGTIGAGGIGGDGVNITGGSGAVTVAASIAKTNAGNVVEVSSHTGGAVTFSGNLSATGGAANGILLSNNSGGTIAFSGATKTLTTGANNAIQFDNNAATGAAVSFTGGNLDIDTTSGRGITGTSTTAGAGSLTIQGTNNTITSVGGIALNLVNTNISAGGLNFLSISANGGARGIVLNTTGGAGGLTVTGTGTTDGSGGTIQNITQRGIELLNTALVNISNLNLTNASTTGQAAGQDLDLTTANGAIYMSGVATAVFENINITGTIADNGITGINVSNFQLNNSLITGAGDGAHESGIEFSNLSGTSSLTNTEIALSETNSLDIVNTDVNLNLTLNNVIFRDTQTSGIGEGGLQFRSFSSAAGTPTTNIDIIDSDFLRIRTQGIQIIGEDDSVVSVDITNSVIDSQTGIGAGIDINGNDTSTVRFNIIGNPTIRSSGGAAINITSFISANVMGRISNNANINVYSQTPAGTGASGSGVRLLAQENSHLTVAVTGNTLTQGAGNNSSAVDVIAREGSARLDLTLTGNIIDSTDINTLADINLQSGSSSGTNIETNQIYANIANNNLTATAAPNLLRLRVSELDNTHDPRIFLQGFVEGGAGIEDDAVATWNANGNTPLATTSNIAVSLSGTATGPSAGTAQIPTNPLP